MKFDEAIRIALDVASDSKPATQTKAPAGTRNGPEPAASTPTPPKVAEALAVLQAIAGDAESIMTTLQAQADPQSQATIRSLCMVVADLIRALTEASANREGVERSRAMRGSVPLEEYLRLIEQEEIATALESSRYNGSEAAKRLGLTYRALRYKLEKYGFTL